MTRTKYYTRFVLTFLQRENLEAGTSLVQVLKNGKRVVRKKDLKELYPPTKAFLYEFSKEHPQVFKDYKQAVAPTPPVQNAEIEDVQAEPREADLAGLCTEFLSIAAGGAQAAEYHQKVLGILEAIFYPELAKFVKEQEIHEGRKRVDVVATNFAREGFFLRLSSQHNVQCPYIFSECKNYSTDPSNPELDQLFGRLSHQRGMFGVLVCRTIDDMELMVKRPNSWSSQELDPTRSPTLRPTS